ncbi:MAG: hypothetical protein B9S32_11935 [Verrucomicrobia bacterium Tous-C9LFEB]|nr:MAG: hypothetical protein B9S32_11935 [Verrucomicrobia bacterium Tous-C9LFEB]
MAIEYKDYYQTLGITKTASEDDIRKAFRKLARQYHPDVAKDKAEGERKFKEINEAYEVLSDPEKRRKYDTLGPNWEQAGAGGPGGFNGGGYRRAGGGQPGGYTWRSSDGEESFEFGGTGFSDFFEAMFGSMGGGYGDDANFGPRTTRRSAAPRQGKDLQAEILVSLEEALRGSVRQITVRRSTAPGRPPREEVYQVKVPAGVHEGQMIRMAGQGEKSPSGGKPGDLYLRVRLERHPEFRVEGSHLYYDLPLAPWEAALGSHVQIPTLEGHVSLKIPASTQAGQKLRLRGQGLPIKDGGRGDLYAIAQIEMPPHISDKEHKLWEELAKVSHFTPRAE